MSDTWIEIIMGLNGVFLAFVLERIFSFSTKIGNMKVEVLKDLQNHQTKMSEHFEKQTQEGILAHKRMDVSDRLLSAVTDEEFNSSKNIALGHEPFPSTTVVRRVIQKHGREI